MAENEGEAIKRLEAEALLKDERIAGLVAEIENLYVARDHRAPIEQAKGVLMSTMRIGPDAAFAVLVAASQRENRKLYDIACEIAAAQEETGGNP